MKNKSFNINVYDQTYINSNNNDSTSTLRYNGSSGYLKQSLSPISRSPPVEIYDFDMLELETSSSSSSLTSSEYNNLNDNNHHLYRASSFDGSERVSSNHSVKSGDLSGDNKQLTSRSSITTNSSFHSSSGSTSSYNDEAFTFQGLLLEFFFLILLKNFSLLFLNAINFSFFS